MGTPFKNQSSLAWLSAFDLHLLCFASLLSSVVHWANGDAPIEVRHCDCDCDCKCKCECVLVWDMPERLELRDYQRGDGGQLEDGYDARCCIRVRSMFMDESVIGG